jgi:hypothetical protein
MLYAGKKYLTPKPISIMLPLRITEQVIVKLRCRNATTIFCLGITHLPRIWLVQPTYGIQLVKTVNSTLWATSMLPLQRI